MEDKVRCHMLGGIVWRGVELGIGFRVLRLQDPATGVLIYKCSECGWESDGMHSVEADEPDHLCADDCPDCKGRGRIEGIPMRVPHGIEIEPRYCKTCGGKGKRKK